MSKIIVMVTYEMTEDDFPTWASHNKISDIKEFNSKIIGLEIGPVLYDFEPYDDDEDQE